MISVVRISTTDARSANVGVNVGNERQDIMEAQMTLNDAIVRLRGFFTQYEHENINKEAFNIICAKIEEIANTSTNTGMAAEAAQIAAPCVVCSNGDKQSSRNGNFCNWCGRQLRHA